MRSTLTLVAITLDCADPLELAAFYQRVTGHALHPKSDDEFAGLSREDGLFIGFQRVNDYQPPHWPGQSVPQQLHLDFAVEDIGAAEAMLLELGAAKPEHQPGGDRFRILLDPAGHPFCLVPSQR
ncbi:VOC family protein [Micromonospora sp. NPDC049374]|uniref:VOC family protein n=1 Tax=Micromonospora sp. NPDC049374 TaxID=3154352 RepID=UPI00341D089E